MISGVQVFLDEVNTSSCVGLFKEIIVDRTFDGVVSDLLYSAVECFHFGSFSSPFQTMCLLWLPVTLTVATAWPLTDKRRRGSEGRTTSASFTQLFASSCGTMAHWMNTRRETISMPK